MPKPGPDSIAWVRDLARPYLRGYRARAARTDGLRGFFFVASTSSRSAGQAEAGFFVGYLDSARAWSFLAPEAPECLVFAFVGSSTVGSSTGRRRGPLHKRLVAAKAGLVRRTFEYIRWLTHRPPRFQFFESELPALVRHRTMSEWPPEKRQHLSRNFFIETLAWLVRSGLVRKLADEAAQRPAAKPSANRATKRAKRKPAKRPR